MALISKCGEHGAVWYAIAGAGAALDPPRRPAYARAARTVAVSFGVNQAVMIVRYLRLAVHYPSDTLAGAALGVAVAELSR